LHRSREKDGLDSAKAPTPELVLQDIGNIEVFMKSLLTLPQIRAFCALAQFRSFKAAAEYLGVSQPTVVNQIASIEESYRTKLFQRQRENNRLTDIGVALVAPSRAVLDHFREAEFILLSHTTAHTGELNIAAVNPMRTSKLIREFRMLYPHIKVNISFVASDKAQNLIDSEAVDVGFFVQNEKRPGQQTFHFYSYELMALLPRGHRLCEKPALTLADFSGQELLIRERGSLTRKMFLEGLAGAGVDPLIAYELSSRESVREAVAQGLGVSVVAEDEHTDHERIVTKKILGDALKANSSLVVPNKHLASPMVKTLIELVRTR
jgi:DNA-binding transcriptional LysR family regulator